MTKNKTSQKAQQPGGRHLSTIEIICVCILFLVAYIFVTNRPATTNDDEMEKVERHTADNPSAMDSNQKKTRLGHNGTHQIYQAFTPQTTASTPIREVPKTTAQMIQDQVTARLDVVAAVDTGNGSVSVQYSNGEKQDVPMEQFLGFSTSEVPLTSVVHPTKNQGLFRSPVDDLQPHATEVKISSENEDVLRSVQLGTFKRTLAEHGKYNRATREALANLIPEEIPIAINSVDALEWNEGSRELMQMVMAKWGKTDPMGALAHAESYNSLRKRNDAVTAVLNSYAKNDPEGALRWYFSNLETDPRTKNFNPSHVFKELAKEDFNNALARVNQIDNPNIRQSSLKYMLGTLESSERLNMIEHMFHQSPSVSDQKMFATEYVMNKSRYEPYEAANWIANNIQNEDVQANAINTLIYNWSADRPDQAAEWVMRLADDELRQKQLSNISRNWARYDPEGADAWLSSFPPDPDLDGAVYGHISTLRKDDPQSASEWVYKLADPQKRSSAERNIARDWIKVDPVGARNFILGSSLEEKYRDRYLNEANAAIAAQQQLESAIVNQP